MNGAIYVDKHKVDYTFTLQDKRLVFKTGFTHSATADQLWHLRNSQNAGLRPAMLAITVSVCWGNLGVLCNKTFSVRNSRISARIPDFFRPKPGQFRVDPGNLNFMKIC